MTTFDYQTPILEEVNPSRVASPSPGLWEAKARTRGVELKSQPHEPSTAYYQATAKRLGSSKDCATETEYSSYRTEHIAKAASPGGVGVVGGVVGGVGVGVGVGGVAEAGLGVLGVEAGGGGVVPAVAEVGVAGGGDSGDVGVQVGEAPV